MGHRPALVLAVAVTAGPASAGTAAAQARFELSLHAIGSTAPQGTLVGGPGVAWLASRRDRLVFRTGIGGREGGGAAGRLEAVWQVRVFPEAPRPGFYGGAGAGVAWADSTRGMLILLIGLEGRPAGRTSWVAEAGVGGGLRVLIGYRVRL